MRSAETLGHWDTSIPGPGEWVEGSVLLQLQPRSQPWVGSDPWPGNCICRREAKKEKKRTVFRVPWWLSGIKVRRCHCCGSDHCGGVGSGTLIQELSHAVGAAQNKHQKTSCTYGQLTSDRGGESIQWRKESLFSK